MEVNAKIYATGFDSVNIPIDISVIFDNFNPVYENNLIINNLLLSKIKVALNFDIASNCDYVVLTTNEKKFFCYTIENLKMLNDKTVEFSLLIDALTTLGGLYNIKVSGTVERYNVEKEKDIFGAYTLPEAFSPNEPLTLELSNKFGQTSLTSINQVIELCVDIDVSKKNTAKVMTPSQATANNEVLLIPETKAITQSSVLVDNVSIKNPISQYFDNTNGGQNEKINLMRQFGLENSIINSYVLPTDYATFPQGAQINQIVSKDKTIIPNNINLIYNQNIRNKKVFCGEFNKLILLSNCSGEKVEVLPEDVSVNGETPNIYITADGRANGQPVAQFKSFKGKDTTKIFLNAVKGLIWQNAPLVWTDKSGSNVDRLNLETSQRVENQNFQINSLSNLSKSFLNSINKESFESIVNFGFDTFISRLSLNIKQNAEREIFERNQYYVQPVVSFPRSESVRDYCGNSFYLIHYKLSNNDLIQYDTYLSRFGYNVANLEYYKDMIQTRTKFQYIKFRSVYIMDRDYIPIREFAKNQLLTGVRLWKVAPKEEYLTAFGND